MTPLPSTAFRFAGTDFKGGFGEQILGQSWVGHYGQNHHSQSTRIDLVECPKERKHPILRGVSKVHVTGGWVQRRTPTRLEYSDHGSTPDVDGARLVRTIRRSHPWLASGPATYYRQGRKQGQGVYLPVRSVPWICSIPGYRRAYSLNGIYWSVGLENED